MGTTWVPGFSDDAVHVYILVTWLYRYRRPTKSLVNGIGVSSFKCKDCDAVHLYILRNWCYWWESSSKFSLRSPRQAKRKNFISINIKAEGTIWFSSDGAGWTGRITYGNANPSLIGTTEHLLISRIALPRCRLWRWPGSSLLCHASRYLLFQWPESSSLCHAYIYLYISAFGMTGIRFTLSCMYLYIWPEPRLRRGRRANQTLTLVDESSILLGVGIVLSSCLTEEL